MRIRDLEIVQAWGWKIEISGKGPGVKMYEIDKANMTIRLYEQNYSFGYYWWNYEDIDPFLQASALEEAIKEVVNKIGKPEKLSGPLAHSDQENWNGVPYYAAWYQAMETKNQLLEEVKNEIAIEVATNSAGLPLVIFTKAGDISQIGKLLRKAGKNADEAEVVIKSGKSAERGYDAAKNAPRRGVDVGDYRDVKGHHVHAKAGFKGHGTYSSRSGFSVSQDYMQSRGWNHSRMTAKQRELFDELAKSGRPNTIKEHTRIAVESLISGGASREEARRLVAESLRNLRQQGACSPSHIPWN